LKPLVVQRPFGKNTYIPAGCIHYPEGEADLLKRWVAELRSAENGFTVLCGDSTDAERTHYREHLRAYRADKNSQAPFDKFMRGEVEKLAKVMKPVAGKVLGVILGNHYHEFSDGTNSEQYLAGLLGVPYLGPLGAIRLDFMEGDTRRLTLTLVAHHNGGKRSAAGAAADLRQLESLEHSWEADIYTLSHTHRRLAHKSPIFKLQDRGEAKLMTRTKVFIRTGCMLKGYGEDEPTTTRPHTPHYAEEACYRPLDLGWVRCEIGMKKDTAGAVKVTYALTT
jgi:hypothetical protein